MYDVRDDNAYDIKKLPDGNCWMVDDLKIFGPLTLTSDDSNTTYFELPAATTATSGYCTGVGKNCVNTNHVINISGTALYNYYAATANTGNYSTEAGTSAPEDICPKNWRMPMADELVALDKSLGFSGSNRTSASDRVNYAQDFGVWPNFALTGHVGSSTGKYTTGTKYIMSSTTISAGYYYTFYLDTSNAVQPHRNTTNSGGGSVRCLAY